MGDAAVVTRIGEVEIDIPRTLGFYGGIAAAVTLGVIEPPLGLFIALLPAAKMLASSRGPRPLRWVAQVLEGAGKPVGSDGQGTVRLAPDARHQD